MINKKPEPNDNYAQNIINSTITDKQRYDEILNLAMDDLTGIVRAYKNCEYPDSEMETDVKTFLEEYTANLLNMIRQ